MTFMLSHLIRLFAQFSILWGPRGNEPGLRPPGVEFKILCLEGSVTSFISPSPFIHLLFSLLSSFVVAVHLVLLYIDDPAT